MSMKEFTVMSAIAAFGCSDLFMPSIGKRIDYPKTKLTGFTQVQGRKRLSKKQRKNLKRKNKSKKLQV